MVAVYVGPGLLDPAQKDRPPLVPVTPLPKIRLYRGDFGATSPAHVRQVKPGLLNKAAFTYKGSAFQPGITTPVDTWGRTPVGVIYPAVVNNTELIVVSWTGGATLTTPAGWTLAASRTQGSLKVSAFYRTAPSSGWVMPTFTFSGTVTATIQYTEWEGLFASSQFDKTAQTGSTFVGQLSVPASVGVSGSLAQADELILAISAVSPQGNFNSGSPFLVAGTDKGVMVDQIGSPDFTEVDQTLWMHTVKSVSTPSVSVTFSSRDGNAHSGDALLILLTFKSSTTPERYARLGEFDLAQGSFTQRAYELGDFTMSVSLQDPLASSIEEDSIVECWVPDYPDFINYLRVPWTHGWYVVRHITEDESAVPVTRHIQGIDLRDLVGRRTIEEGMVTTAIPGTGSAEDWARHYVNLAIISNPDINLRLLGMSIEATNGHRGTIYTEPPARVGAGIGDTITQLYRKDKLGWRVVVKNPGTTTATLEFQTYAENDRTFGKIGQAVFKESWDTAQSVRLVRDAVNASNYLRVLGAPVDGSVRQVQVVSDAESIAKWGPLTGEVDASTETVLTEAIANTYLEERLPKEWTEVIPRNTFDCRLGQHYNLLDLCTAITRDGTRFDGNLLSLTLNTHQTAQTDFGTFLDPAKLPIATPLPYKGPATMTFILGSDPASAPDGGRDRRPAELRKYTYLEDLTVGSYAINSAGTYASGTPGVTVPNKTLVPNGSKQLDELGVTTFDATTLKKAGTTIAATAPEIDRVIVTPGTPTPSKALVPDDAGGGIPRVNGTLRVATLQAGAGANGAVADGATRNPQQAAVTDLPGDGSAGAALVETKINEILARLRLGGEIST